MIDRWVGLEGECHRAASPLKQPRSGETPTESLATVRDLADLYRANFGVFRTALRTKFARGPSALSEDDIDDAIQDAFARLLCMCRAGETAIGVPAAYMFAVARNRCVSMLRRRKLRDAELSVDELPNAHPEEPQSSVSASGWIAEYLIGASSEVMNVYELRFVQGLPQRGCAARLGVSRKRVRAIESALIRALREYWAATRGEPIPS